MNREIALDIANRALQQLRKLSYQDCLALMKQRSQTTVAIGSDGKQYQVETQTFWDSKKSANIRVMVSVDDGGLRAFRPLTRAFIIAPDGSFVGEN
jgi:hypothetical protein